jgi:hypothetical protein
MIHCCIIVLSALGQTFFLAGDGVNLNLVVAVAGASLPSFPGLLSLILVEGSLQRGSEQVVLMVVGAVVVALSFNAAMSGSGICRAATDA